METGIVVEGGGVRDVHVTSVLDILLEHGAKVGGLVSVSAGATHGCGFVTGQTERFIHYNLKYCHNPRYMSSRSLVTTGDLVGNEFCCRELPERLGLFDNDTLEISPMESYTTCTDVETGRPVYHKHDSLGGESIQQIRASASMPLVSRIVEIDGHKLLDRGVSDSIPTATFRKMGLGRSLATLTRPDGCCERPSHMLPVIRRVYRRYPEFIKTMECHHLMYNQELEEVRHMEATGGIFIVRPNRLVKISRTENRPEKIQQMYELGRLDGMKAFRDTAGFLGVEPAVCG